MFRKILIAEDFDSVNIAIEQTLKELEISDSHHARYCDKALLEIKKGLQQKEPYDLLISDLSFLEDHTKTTIASGEELIAEVRKIQPDIKIIVFSIEKTPYRVKLLFDQYNIAGYVSKGRHSMVQLRQAMSDVFQGKRFLSPELGSVLNDHSLNEIDQYDTRLLELLAEGYKQDEIAERFRRDGLHPSSVSALEKRLNTLKIIFKANNTVHLVSLAKNLRVIK